MTKLKRSAGFVDLTLVFDPELQRAAGRVALAHGQLELMLRMTIKTLSGLTVKQALTKTKKYKNSQLRKEINTLFEEKTPDVKLRQRLQNILRACDGLSGQRNRLLHKAWALSPDGSLVAKGDDHAWGPGPSVAELDTLAIAITDKVAALNDARLRGFIHEVVVARAQ